MRNFFLFVRRYFTFISFLVLQGIAIWMLLTYNRFHRGKGMGMANEVTGWINTKYNGIEDFFQMKEENKRLLRRNDSLTSLLKENFLPLDTAVRISRDSLPYDTIGNYRRFAWREAQVVFNTVNLEKNYVQINRGSKQGIKDNMGVISSNGGLIGQVVSVSPNFSTVMSLLHVQNRISVQMKKTGTSGMISWDAKNPAAILLSGIPKSDSAKIGDTVLTGNFSLSFPPGQLVGTVSRVATDQTTNSLAIRLKPFANFTSLQQVLVVENLQFAEQQQLLNDTKNKVESSKNKKP